MTHHKGDVLASDDDHVYAALAECYPGKMLRDLDTTELSFVLLKAQELKVSIIENPARIIRRAHNHLVVNHRQDHDTGDTAALQLLWAIYLHNFSSFAREAVNA
jgi:hypothetical protein